MIWENPDSLYVFFLLHARKLSGREKNFLDGDATLPPRFLGLCLSVDLADRDKGADDGSEKDGAATQPDVEEQQELEGGLSLRKLAVISI